MFLQFSPPSRSPLTPPNSDPNSDSNPNPNPNPLSASSLIPSSLSLSPSTLSSFPQPSLCEPDSSVLDNYLSCSGMIHLYKNQLQSYAQKRNLSLPVYSSESEGPPHAMRFKCKVTIDGQTYESDKFYSTLKDAEHAAAEVALMSLSPDRVHEDHTGLYKNLLQELVQKEGFHLPIYCTNKSGEAHMPIFVSQVEVEGELFTGQEAKSKKQAEMGAAKVAYMALKERKGKSDQRYAFPLSVDQLQAREFSSDLLEAKLTTDLHHHANPKSPTSPGLVNLNQPNKDKGKLDQSSSSPLSAHKGEVPEFSSDHPELKVVNDLQHNANSKSLISPGLVTQNQPNVDKVKKGSASSGNTNGCTEDSLSNVKSAPSLSGSTKVVSDTSDMPSTEVGTPSHQKKVVVYSLKTNVNIEDGGTLLPFSDDKWVAYKYSH